LNNLDIDNSNFEADAHLQKVRKEVLKKFSEYRNTLNYLAADAPIQVLCLPYTIEKILLGHGILRVYELFNLDLVKIKGLGEVRIRQLTSCLDQFFAML